ncbi:LOW QUALITY PROTEIN: hypothetical protein T265_14924 [Opisthorchis viverrini]|uniref:Uncharacterized protein n=1 Tax=Opisthorchis viverrini TaxID=6198 RepID=A0A075A483_OPIVI|nr:LOW QUALITY PROTEIN: hypothetical protein T265_14924 [Opisthorchis viverrini]KER22184.1 LOW QUALITY PROTEIN: hypothetical protein T265_14924 [Opisthorchis viverrini]
MLLEGSKQDGILPGFPSPDRGSREAEVGFEPRTFRSYIGLILPSIQSIKQLLLPTGRMVGGTAMLNAMLFSFGHPEDETFRLFSQWNPRFFSELYQEPGHPEQVLTCCNPNLEGQETVFIRPLTIDQPGCHFSPTLNYRHLLNEKFHVALSEVFKSLGFPVRDSPDGWVKEGLQTPLVFVQNYARWSSYANCLEPLLQHEDAQVTILPETLVEKLSESEFAHLKVRGSDLTPASRLPLSRLGQPGSISSFVLDSGSMTDRRRTGATAEQTNMCTVLFDPHKPGFVKGVVVAHKSASFPIWLSNASEANPIHPLPEPSNITSLPVGLNLHDHPMIVLVCTFQKPVAINTKVVTPLEMLRYIWSGKTSSTPSILFTLWCLVISIASALSRCGVNRSPRLKNSKFFRSTLCPVSTACAAIAESLTSVWYSSTFPNGLLILLLCSPILVCNSLTVCPIQILAQSLQLILYAHSLVLPTDRGPFTCAKTERDDTSVPLIGDYLPLLGALSQAGAISSVAYLRTSLQRIQNSSKPDIQFTFIAAAVFEQEIFQKLTVYSNISLPLALKSSDTHAHGLAYQSLTLFNHLDEMYSALWCQRSPTALF